MELDVTAPTLTTKVYKFPDEHWFAEWKKAAIKGVRSMLLLVCLPIMARLVAGQLGGLSDWLLAVSSGLGIVIVLNILSLLSFRSNYRLAASFQTEIGPDSITQRIGDGQGITIRRDESLEVTESQLGLLVYAGSTGQKIIISRGLEGYDEIKVALGSWGPIQQDRPLLWRLPRWVMPVLTIVSAMILLSSNSIGLLLLVAVLLAILTYLVIRDLPSQSKARKSANTIYMIMMAGADLFAVWRFVSSLR